MRRFTVIYNPYGSLTRVFAVKSTHLRALLCTSIGKHRLESTVYGK